MTLQRGGHVVESLLGLLAQHTLAGTETDFCLGSCLILVDVAHHLLDGRETSRSLLRGLLRLLGTVASINGVLIGLIRLGCGQLDTLRSPAVDVLDHLAIRGGEFVQLVHAVANRLSLPLHVLLTGERVQVAPEAFVSLRLQGFLPAGPRCGLRVLGSRRSLRGRLILRGGAVLLSHDRNGECGGQQQSEDCAVLHGELPPKMRELGLHSSPPGGPVTF